MDELILNDFEKAVQRLEEVLEVKKTTISRDSAIKRFELCFDLAWKTVKSAAADQGLMCASPRASFNVAFKLGWIEHDSDWIDMIADRNTSVHLYEERFAERIYKKLPGYLKLFKELLSKFQA